MASEWEYHQDGRDRAATLGCAGIVAIAIIVALFVVAAAAWAVVDAVEAEALRSEWDGSNAGANAVTLEDLAKDEWESGAWSVTTTDLDNKPEPGETYPSNGKNTPLDSDTTYGKGAGMVDIITYDSKTNVEVRHYGQHMPDGSVRWYAAETVLDEDGKPVVMPRE